MRTLHIERLRHSIHFANAVGPAGVIVRVIMSPDGGDDNEEGGNREMTSIDMPIQFVETSLGQHHGGTSIRQRALTLFL